MVNTTSSPRILLTGATGFIGGSVLAQLLDSTSPSLRSAPITCLVRGADRAAKLKATYGERVNPVLYGDLDDLETTAAVAAQHDVVISTTPGFLTGPARALQEGLARRKRERPGSQPWLIHTSGTSNVSSRSVSGAWLDNGPSGGGIFDDAVDDIYGYEAARDAAQPYIQRTAELSIINSGLELDMRTLVLMPPTIYGVGSGLFNKRSVQIPAFVSAALNHGRAIVIGDGKGMWDHVHVRDLAALYELLALRALDNDGEGLPWGRKGIVFASNGRHSWNDIAGGIAQACHEAGVLPDVAVDNVGLAEAPRLFGDAYLGESDEMMIELGLASSGETVATVARRLGWKPVLGQEAWEKGFRDDVDAVLRERREKDT